MFSAPRPWLAESLKPFQGYFFLYRFGELVGPHFLSPGPLVSVYLLIWA